MSVLNLRILEYHRFADTHQEYPFSRTYQEFIDDLRCNFDWITMDDGLQSQIRACKILKGLNIRAKLGITTTYFSRGTAYMTEWDVKKVSMFHDIENHTHTHKDLTTLSELEIMREIQRANEIITEITRRKPRYLIPPFNKVNTVIENIAAQEGLQVIKQRITVRKDTIL